MKARKKAFTLIEMMAVVTIIGVLATIVAMRAVGPVGESREIAARTEIQNMNNAVSLFFFNTGRYPTQLSELIERPDGLTGWRGPYMQRNDFEDPWGNDYLYASPGNEDREFEICSLGQDRIQSEDDLRSL